MDNLIHAFNYIHGNSIKLQEFLVLIVTQTLIILDFRNYTEISYQYFQETDKKYTLAAKIHFFFE